MKERLALRTNPFTPPGWCVAAATIVAVLGMAFAPSLGAATLTGGGEAPASHVTPEYIPGAYLSLACTHSSISTGGKVVCHDGSWGPTIMCGGGSTCSYTYTETMDTGYTFHHWGSSGAACIGTSPSCGGLSTTSTVSIWMYGPATGKSSGTLGVNIPGHGPGCSSYSTTSVTGVTTSGGASTTNAADVYATLAWTVSTAGGTTYVEWGGSGPLSGYDAGWTSFSSSSTSQSYTIYNLKPGATMYYSIDAEPGGCNIGGVATGSFTSPSGGSSRDLYGYVYDGSTGAAYYGAHVVAYWKCTGSTWYSVTTATVLTASDGSYSIPISSTPCAVGGTWSGVLNWSSYASGYWRTEYTPSSPLTSFDGVDNWQVFALALQTISPTWTGLAFVNGGADAACSITSSYTMSTSVAAYAAGTGATVSGSYSTSTTYAGSSGNGLATYFGYSNNGVLEVASDGLSYSVKNAWLSGTPTTGTATFTSTNPTMPSDYLSAAPSGTTITSLAAGTTGAVTVTIGGTATIQLGVIADVGISVGFLGIVDVSVSATLQLTWSQTTSVSNGITCTLGHTTSTGTEKFQVYVEDSSSSISGYNGLVVHIWQL